MAQSSATPPSTARRSRLFSLKEILFMGLPLAFVASWWVVPEPMYFGLWAVGKTGVCPMQQSVAVRRVVAEMNETTKAIAKESAIELKEPQADGLWRWKTPWGAFWAPPETSVPFLLAEQMTRVYGDGERRVRKGDVVLDCGANIGTFTREALNAGAKLVVAIEPSERNVEAMRRTFAKEIAEGRVIVYPKGVWHQEEVLTFHVYENSAFDSFVMEGREDKRSREVKVPVTTIDRIVAELGIAKVDFIKMDIEGAERNAVRGAGTTIAKFHPRMSIAMENLPDDQFVVPPLVQQAWSGYRVECGRCSLSDQKQIQPDVMFFY